jgi:ankyrin repeat protein
MKQLLITIAAVVLVGCCDRQESINSLKAKPVKLEADRSLLDATKIARHSWNIKSTIETAKKAINDGADVNAKTRSGYTPLYWAAYSDQKEVVQLLIAKGADVNAKNKYGDTPLDVAINFGNRTGIHGRRTGIPDLLRKHGGKTGEELKAEGK